MNRLLIASATLALLVSACAAGPGSPGETDPTTTTPPASTPSPDDSDDGRTGELDQATLDALVEQASEETGVGGDEISVVTAEAVTWSDGSIGCPEEGMGYTQALVPGYRVVLDVAGEEIHYHAGSDGEFFACDDPQPPAESTTDR